MKFKAFLLVCMAIERGRLMGGLCLLTSLFIFLPTSVAAVCAPAHSSTTHGIVQSSQQSTAPTPVSARADGSQAEHLAPATAAKATTLNIPTATVSFDPPPPVIRRVTTNANLVPIAPATFAHALEAIDKGILFLKSTQSANGGWMEGIAAAPTATMPTSGLAGGDSQVKSVEAANSANTSAPIPAQAPSLNAANSVASNAASAAVTALVVRAFAQRGLSIQGDAALDRAATRLVDVVMGKNGFQPDASGGMATYVASCTAMGLAALQEAKYEKTLSAALAWIRESQWDESEGIAPTQDWYGGRGLWQQGPARFKQHATHA